VAGSVKAVLTPTDYLKLSPGQQAAVRRWLELHGFDLENVAHLRIVDNLAELLILDRDNNGELRWDHSRRQPMQRIELVDVKAEFPIR
jgi:hypothetical protein